MRNTPLAPLTAAVLAMALLLGGCQSVQTTQPGAVGVTRAQSMSVSREEVDAASAKAYAQLLQESQAKGVLNRDAAMLARVQGVSRRLIAQTAAFRPDAPGWRWEVNLLTSDEVNAFCMAGGKIAVYSGIITKLQLSDDELAAVIGHEMAHALREHVREQVSEQQNLGLLAAIAGAALGSQTAAQGAGQLSQLVVGLPHSRRAETEADDIGVELAARAGFDPRAAVGLWDKMGRLGGGRPPEFLSTHPSPANRQQDLQRAAQVVMPLYQQATRRR